MSSSSTASKKLDLKSKSVKKIESPLAKYNGLGQLFCVLCNSQVKNEMYWTGHVNGKQHREALQVLKSGAAGGGGAAGAAGAKKRPSQIQEGPTPSKKPAITPSGSDDFNFKRPNEVTGFSPSSSSFPKKQLLSNAEIFKQMEKQQMMEIENGSSICTNKSGAADSEDDEDSDEDDGSGSAPDAPPTLPEGFFDDPKLDAKARGLDYKNPDELEWDNFVKEIAGEEVKSSSMRVEDEEESTKSRELDEIEEQMAHWQKVIDLEKKAEEVRQAKKQQEEAEKIQKSLVSKSKSSPMDQDNSENESDELDLEYDEELDWRSKNR